jgi:hypothetical protein
VAVEGDVELHRSFSSDGGDVTSNVAIDPSTTFVDVSPLDPRADRTFTFCDAYSRITLRLIIENMPDGVNVRRELSASDLAGGCEPGGTPRDTIEPTSFVVAPSESSAAESLLMQWVYVDAETELSFDNTARVTELRFTNEAAPPEASP